MEALEELMVKRSKRVRYDDIDIYEMEGNLEDLINRLTLILEDAKEEGATDISCSAECDFGDYDEGYAYLRINGTKFETEQEVDTRIDNYNKDQLTIYLREQEKLSKEKETYLELKAKYEKELG